MFLISHQQKLWHAVGEKKQQLCLYSRYTQRICTFSDWVSDQTWRTAKRVLQAEKSCGNRVEMAQVVETSQNKIIYS